MKKTFYIFLSALVICVSLSCCSTQKDKRVVVASKNYTENILIGEMYAQLIENHTDIVVERKEAFGGTPICYNALKNGEVDIYVDYTGTLYNEMLKLDNLHISPDEMYEIVKVRMDESEDVTVFSPIGINNNYALGMLREKANALGIKTMSELSGFAPKLIFAANSLYYARANDGFATLTETYGYSFKSTVKMDIALLYETIEEEGIDVIIVYATDSRLKQYNMILLEDDKQMFPAYYGLPIARNETLKKYPELNEVLELLKGRISNEKMQELNYMVDIKNIPPAEVAETFLREESLLK